MVGRKDCDINFGDKSVSRKHAQIVIDEAVITDPKNEVGEGIQRPHITVCDLGSTYGIYLNDKIDQDKDRLPKKVPQVLQHGDIVRFGQQCAAVRVLWEPIILCHSRANKQEKANLKVWSKKAGAQLVSEWNSQVTHLVTGKVSDIYTYLLSPCSSVSNLFS